MLLRAPVEDRDHIRLVAREGDEVGRVRVLAPEGPHEVAERLAVAVGGALVGLGAEQALERARRGDAGLRQGELLDARRLLDADAVEPEAIGERRAELLELRGVEPLVLEAPAPELAASGGGCGHVSTPPASAPRAPGCVSSQDSTSGAASGTGT